MRQATDLGKLAAFEDLALSGVAACSDTPLVIVLRGSAGNDATCEDPAFPKDEVEAWAQHALAANAFGDHATADIAFSMRPTSYELHQAARAHRSFALSEIIVAGIQAAGAIARTAYARYRQLREAKAADDQLQQLDDRTGSFALSEIIFAGIQAAGASARRAYARYRQRREAKAAHDQLQQLDDRTLRDIGFDRSESRSVAAELTGEAEYTRVRILLASHDLPSARRW